MDRKFDFTEMDEALSGAGKIQETERMTDALEDNYKAVRILSDQMERLEVRLSEALTKTDGVVSSLQQASRVTVSEESRQTLAREGDAICLKIADRLESECARMVGRLSGDDRVTISSTAFWCMVETLVSLGAAFACTCAANLHFMHSALLWKMLGCTVLFLVVSIALTIIICRKLKR